MAKSKRVPASRRLVPVLTIAGSDPSGGAGLQADLKTFQRFRTYGMAVVSLLTVQNTRRVSRVKVLDSGLVDEQLCAVLEDIPPAAIKTGALGSAGVIRAVSRRLRDLSCPLIVDPVMISKHGASLLDKDAQRFLAYELLPQAFLVTPNLREAEALSGIRYRGTASLLKMAQKILEFGPAAVLIKGGHREGASDDYLLDPAGEMVFHAARIRSGDTHGTGCTLSAAITAGMARGLVLRQAVARAKQFVTRAIRTSPGLGAGAGPLNHLA